MLQFLESKLYSDVEGTCSGQFGYIIAVVSILDIGKGMVLSGSGQAEFITRYRAIVFKPFKGEVVDGVVNNVNKVRHIKRPVLMDLTFIRGLDGFLCGSRAFDDIRVPPGADCNQTAQFDRCLNGPI
jgi:DNA-directed RNA polymerase subunit E'/Rpb7